MNEIELKPIRESPDDFDELEKEIKKLFREEIYLPLISELGPKHKIVSNSTDDLIDAIRSGRIYFYRGQFRGKFNSTLSRELRRIGAEWDRRQGSFSIPQSKLPIEVRDAVQVSERRFDASLQKIDEKLAKILPAEIAEKLRAESFFEKTLFKVEKKFQKSIDNITVAPDFTPEQQARIAREYTQNMQLYIRDFTEKEIAELRKKIEERSLSGVRYDGIIAEIQRSYGVSQRKAKFLARQETSLLMTKFKQVRYQDAGVEWYRWTTVHMPHDPAHGPHTKGNVRYSHYVLNGKKFRWDNPPVINEKGDRKNPGQDFNCRCVAIPIVRF